MKLHWFVYGAVISLLCAACSSAPKRAMLVRDVATQATSYFEMGNNELAAGQIESAGINLQKAYTLAASVDDADLLCRISLSAVIYRLAVATADVSAVSARGSQNAIPFAGLSSETLLARAQEFARRTTRADVLAAICAVYEQKNAITKRGARADFSGAHAALKTSEERLAKEPYYLAFLYRTRGDVYEMQQNYAQADASYRAAAELHVKNRYLYEIGIDWYSAARVRSLAGNKEAALEAMENALRYDRDAENTPAIAADYFAIARILVKGTPSEQEKSRAVRSALWAAEIYEAGGFVEDALSALTFAEQWENQ